MKPVNTNGGAEPLAAAQAAELSFEKLQVLRGEEGVDSQPSFSPTK